MTGIRVLRKLQLGREAAAGTILPAATLWRGMGVLADQRTVVFPKEDIGYLSSVNRSYTPQHAGALNMLSTEATYEQLLHILEAGVKLVQTGAADGSGSGKIYVYTMPVTAANTLRTYTIEGGDNLAAEVMEYGYVSSFSLDGEAGKALMLSANWGGRRIAPQAFTASVSLPAVEEILFSKCVLYADAVGGTLGATTQSNTLLKASLKVNTGITPVYTANGQLFFSFTKTIEPEILLDITYEHDATSVAEKVNWRAETARQIRLKFTGSAFAIAGSAYAAKTTIIDLAGKWEKFSELGEQDGNNILTGTFRAGYDATAALFAKFTDVVTLTSVP